MPNKEITQEQLKELAQTTANLVINLWLPRYRAWQKEQAKERSKEQAQSPASFQTIVEH